MRITIFRNIGKAEAIDVLTKAEKGKKVKDTKEDFFKRILPTLKGKSFHLKRAK